MYILPLILCIPLSSYLFAKWQKFCIYDIDDFAMGFALAFGVPATVFLLILISICLYTKGLL